MCQSTAGSRVRNKHIFADVLKNETLSKTPVILILNKLDDFQEELKEAKFREDWIRYTGLEDLAPVSLQTEILWVFSPSHSFLFWTFLRKFIEDDLRSLDVSTDREIYIFRTIAENKEFMEQIFVPMISVIIGCHKSTWENADTNKWELLKHRLHIFLYQTELPSWNIYLFWNLSNFQKSHCSSKCRWCRDEFGNLASSSSCP